MAAEKIKNQPALKEHRKLLKPRKVSRSFGGNFAVFTVLFIMGLFMVVPLVYVVMNAFKPLEELLLFPPRFFVTRPTIQNFIDLFNLMDETWVPFSRYIFNTVFITVVTTIGHVLLSSMAAFVLSKHKFFGSKMIFKIIVLSLMFSGAVTGVPNYLTLASFRMIDTPWAIIVPAVQSSLGLYLMKQFMDNVNDSLLESARIDGANEFKVYWSIMMPQVKPAWLTLIILQIQGLWSLSSDFLMSEQNKTLSMAMTLIVNGGVARMGAASAVGLVMMIVPITTFIFTQSRIIETMSASGIKE